MTAHNSATYNERLERVLRDHREHGSGSIYFDQHTGEFVRVVGHCRSRGMPVFALMLFIIGFFLTKGFFLAYAGEITYLDRLAGLEAGTAPEQAAAWAMRIDPITRQIAELMTLYLPGL
ncbi:MAG: hypothetical protein CR993_03785 [Rhodobacterales bacterium]|nr:MAG: hypothetical protein CR993_03785 [Rhodobacterales bacterium]